MKEKLVKIKNKLILYKRGIQEIEEKELIDITLSKSDEMYILEISDYINAIEYFERMNEIDIFDINSKLTNGVLWNSRKQSINKGKYFVFTHNDKLYNILVNDEIIKIEERMQVEEETQERILSLTSNDSNYHYFRCMHDKNGSTYMTRYYSKFGTSMINLELSRNEFINDLNELFFNLKSFKKIEEILDIERFKQLILDDSNKYILERKN